VKIEIIGNKCIILSDRAVQAMIENIDLIKKTDLNPL